MITDTCARALQILADCDHQGIWPSRFADKMWPDSPGHRRSHKCGPYGSSPGAMMPMVAGGYLGKLNRRGFTTQTWSESNQRFHHLSMAGDQALKEWKEAKGEVLEQ